MAINKLKLLAFLGPALVRAQGELYLCDTTLQPDYSNCDDVMAPIDWTEGELPGDPAPIPDGQCKIFSTAENAGNCLVKACNNRGDGAGQPLNVFSGPTYYGIIKQWCEPDDAGGQSPYQGRPTYIEVTNNPDFKPASRAKRAAAGEVVSKMVTIEESEELTQRAKEVAGGSKHRKRQDGVTWTSIAIAQSVKTGERDQLSAASSGGSTQQWSTSEGFSSSVSSTVEVGASFFEIFSASVSLTVGFEYSETYTETLTFDPSGRCEPAQRAILYMYPLFDKYSGTYSDRPNEVIDWLIPVAPPNNYEIDVECLG